MDNRNYSGDLRMLARDMEILKNALGKLHTNSILADINNVKELHEYEFQVYSQWGDDGIIQFLVNYLDIPIKKFVEFGVENYTECNTRFLLMNDNWSGLVIDGSEQNIRHLQNDSIYWKFDLTATAEFVTVENINRILNDNKFTGEIGILHVDIDGNDYWVWKAITVVNPIIVILEYNSVFGTKHPWSIPYDPAFVRTKAHYSNLYFGMSILSACDLATEKGYSFIGCNSNGNNAYFVRNDKVKDLKIKTPEQGYVNSKFAESRSAEGNLTFLRGNGRLELLKGMQVFNTRKNLIETITT